MSVSIVEFENRWIWPLLEHIVAAGLSGGSPGHLGVPQLCTMLGANEPAAREQVKRAIRYLGEKHWIDVAISSGGGDPNYLMAVRGPTAEGIDRLSERNTSLNSSDARTLKAIGELEAAHPDHQSSTEELGQLLGGTPDQIAATAHSVHRLVQAGYLEAAVATNQSSTYPEYLGVRLTLAGAESLEAQRASVASPQAPVVNVYGGATVGQVNLGQVIGNIQTSIEVVSGPRADDFKGALQHLVTAVGEDPDLPPLTKVAVLEQLAYVAEAASEQAAQRRPSVIDAVLEKIPALLNVGAASAKAWEALSPAIIGFFPH